MVKRNCVYTIHDGEYRTNGWTLQAPDIRNDQTTHKSDGKRRGEQRACGRKGQRQGKARFGGLRSALGAEP